MISSACSMLRVLYTNRRHVWHWITLALLGALCFASIIDRSRTASRSSTVASQPAAVEHCSPRYRITDILEDPGSNSTSGYHFGSGYGSRYGSEGCGPQELTESAFRACLHRRRAVLHRPARVTMVGDSRVRNLFQGLADLLNMTVTAAVPPPAPSPPSSDWGDWWERLNTPPERWCARGQGCTKQADGPLAHLSALWHPHMNAHFVRSLDTMLAACSERGRAAEANTAPPIDGNTVPPAGGCPDLVVVNSGLWYTGKMLDKLHQRQLTLLFRQHLSTISARLGRLARSTRTVWKLEEAAAEDFATQKSPGGRPSKEIHGRLIAVMQAVAIELLAQEPSLSVWSSHLPEVTTALFNTCASTVPLYRRKNSDIPAGCLAHDGAHMIPKFYKRLVHPLLAELCRGW